MTFAELFKQLNAKPKKRPTFAGLFKLVSPAFALGILLVLTVQLAFGEFDPYSVPIAVAAWLSLVGILYVLCAVLGKLTGRMWDEYEKQQEAISAEVATADEPRTTGQPLIRSVRLIILVGYANSLVGGILAAIFLGEVLTAIEIGIGLASLAGVMWAMLWLVFRTQFEQSGMRW